MDARSFPGYGRSIQGQANHACSVPVVNQKVHWEGRGRLDGRTFLLTCNAEWQHRSAGGPIAELGDGRPVRQ